MRSAYENGKTLAEIGAENGLSRQRVGQIMKRLGISRIDGGAHVRSAAKKNKHRG